MITTMDEPDELLDLVDAHDNPIGTIQRHEVPFLEKSGRGFTRAIGIFLINGHGQLWIPRRSGHKKIAPNGLDFSAGEHVGASEDYQSAALRGLQEELGIAPDPGKLSLIGSLPPFAGLPYFHEIFTYPFSDEPPGYDKNDYQSAAWIDPDQLLRTLEGGEPAKEILHPSVRLLVHSELTFGGNK